MPVRSNARAASFCLLELLDVAPAGAKLRVLGQRFERLQLRKILDPAIADVFRNELRQFRIGQHHPAPRRHAVGFVAELLRPHFIEVLEDVALEELRVQGGDAVDGMAADTGEVRHAHVALAAFVDDGHAGDARLVAEIANPHLVEEVRVDFIDDLQQPRQHAAEHFDRPALQGLRQQRMIGIAEGLARNAPRPRPRTAALHR